MRPMCHVPGLLDFRLGRTKPCLSLRLPARATPGMFLETAVLKHVMQEALLVPDEVCVVRLCIFVAMPAPVACPRYSDELRSREGLNDDAPRTSFRVPKIEGKKEIERNIDTRPSLSKLQFKPWLRSSFRCFVRIRILRFGLWLLWRSGGGFHSVSPNSMAKHGPNAFLDDLILNDRQQQTGPALAGDFCLVLLGNRRGNIGGK